MLLCEVNSLVEAEKVKNERQRAEEAEQEEAFRQQTEKAKRDEAGRQQFERPMQVEARTLHGAAAMKAEMTCYAELNMKAAAVKADWEVSSGSSCKICLETLEGLILKLMSAAQKIHGTRLGHELSEIASQLQVEGMGSADGKSANLDALKSLIAQLSDVAERLRGVPLGNELRKIVQSLHEQVRDPNDIDACIFDTTGWSVTDLQSAVAGLVEERNELRRSLQGALLQVVEKEEALRHQCEALRSNGETERCVAQSERNWLLAENDRLQLELRAEQVRTHALCAELAALKAAAEQAPQDDLGIGPRDIQVKGRMMQV